MTLLVVYSRFSKDSQILRKSAQQLGWETLRLDGLELPDWVDESEPEVAIFATIPGAIAIAEKFSRTLLGCDADWLPNLPQQFRKREIERATLADALHGSDGRFIKSAITKHLAGKLWSASDLRQAAERFAANLAVYVAEPVEFIVEYRCFIADREVATISPYRRFDQCFDDATECMNEPMSERIEAIQFAQTVLRSRDVATPPAFVLDVGIIKDRGWAVVEANECWASGIYHCDPFKILEVLLKSCIPNQPRTAIHARWNFADHYAAAVPT
jgi:hypothetical protein